MCKDEHIGMSMTSYIPTQISAIWEQLDKKDKQFIILAGYEVYQYTRKISQGKQTQKIQKDYERSLQELRDGLEEKQEVIETYESKLKTTKQSFLKEMQEQQDTFQQEKMRWKQSVQESQRALQEKMESQEDIFRGQKDVWRQRESELQDRIRQVESSSLEIALKKVREHMSEVSHTYTNQIGTLQDELKKWQSMYEKKQEEVTQLMSTVQQQSLHSTAYAKSQKKGETGEYEVLHSLSQSFCMKGMEIKNRSSQGGLGDIHVTDPVTNACCMVEAKNYDSQSVPAKEVEKCERDVRQTKSIDCCIMISLSSPITGHAHEDISWVTDEDGFTKPMLYLTGREELTRLGMWVHILMRLTSDVHRKMTQDVETKNKMIQLIEYQKDMNAMMDQIRPLRKCVASIKAEMGRQITHMDRMIQDIMEHTLSQMRERGILVQEVTFAKNKEDKELIREWETQNPSQYFLAKDFTAYMKQQNVKNYKKIYRIRDRYYKKIGLEDPEYEPNKPTGLKEGETYYKMNSQ